ncbi:hypothetical protein HDU67_008867 [Dinochytrium kinnereticum]|nr:hypothetical protein HDU67_008867 [Dinochytrium kinnereticum]
MASPASASFSFLHAFSRSSSTSHGTAASTNTPTITTHDPPRRQAPSNCSASKDLKSSSFRKRKRSHCDMADDDDDDDGTESDDDGSSRRASSYLRPHSHGSAISAQELEASSFGHFHVNPSFSSRRLHRFQSTATQKFSFIASSPPVPSFSPPSQLPPWLTTPAPSLHHEILALEAYLSPSPAEQRLRRDLISRYRRAIKARLPTAILQVFGSTSTGMGLPWSDMDFVIVDHAVSPSSSNADPPPTQGRQASKLSKVASKLTSSGLATDVTVLRRAKVPIVKLKDRFTGISLDLSYTTLRALHASQVSQVLLCNLSSAPSHPPPFPSSAEQLSGSSSGPAAVMLVKRLKETLPALRPLVLLLKQFLLVRGLSEVFTGGVGGYGCVLWVATFLKLRDQNAWPQSWLSSSISTTPYASSTTSFPTPQPRKKSKALQNDDSMGFIIDRVGDASLRDNLTSTTTSQPTADLGTLFTDFCNIFGRHFDYRSHGLSPGVIYFSTPTSTVTSPTWSLTPAKIFRKPPGSSPRLLSLLDPLDDSVDVMKGSSEISSVFTALRGAWEIITGGVDRRTSGLGNLDERRGRRAAAAGVVDETSLLGRVLGVLPGQVIGRERMRKVAEGLFVEGDDNKERIVEAISESPHTQPKMNMMMNITQDEGEQMEVDDDDDEERTMMMVSDDNDDRLFVPGIMMHDGMVSSSSSDTDAEKSIDGREMPRVVLKRILHQTTSTKPPPTPKITHAPSPLRNAPEPRRVRVGFNGRDKAYRRAVSARGSGRGKVGGASEGRGRQSERKERREEVQNRGHVLMLKHEEGRRGVKSRGRGRDRGVVNPKSHPYGGKEGRHVLSYDRASGKNRGGQSNSTRQDSSKIGGRNQFPKPSPPSRTFKSSKHHDSASSSIRGRGRGGAVEGIIMGGWGGRSERGFGVGVRGVSAYGGRGGRGRGGRRGGRRG